MQLSNQEYDKLVNEMSAKSPTGKNVVFAFLFGGGICAFAQWMVNFFKGRGLEQDMAGTAASIVLIIIAALLTGIGWFDNIAKIAGAGTLVPITGFANAVVSPALEFKSEGMVTGTASKIFTVAGPVLVAGLTASVVYGLFLCLFQ